MNHLAQKREETKKWFEQNYLDGDEVQEGQMVSSQTCLEALLTHEQTVIEGVRKTLAVEGVLSMSVEKALKELTSDDKI